MTRISRRGTSGFVTCWTTSGFVPLLGASNPIGGGTSEVVLSQRVSGFVRDGAGSNIVRDEMSSDVVRDRVPSVLNIGWMALVLARRRGVDLAADGGLLGRSQKLRTEPKTSPELLG